MYYDRKSLYQAVKKDREQFKDFTIEVSDEYMAHVINRVFPKSCYDKCYDYIVRNSTPGLKLVHGTMEHVINEKQSIKIEHAWVEFDNVVFDGVFQRFYDKDLIYRKRGLVKEVEYTFHEVCEKTVKFGHKGPWPEYEKGPVDDRKADRKSVV